MQTRHTSLHQVNSPNRRIESAAVAVLFVLFLIGIYRCEVVEQQADTHDQPSTLAVTRPGAGALYALMQSMGFRVTRFKAPWNQLDQTSGVLVVLEPLSRNPTESENKPLKEWIERGGTLLFVCTGSPQPEDPNDSVAGDIRLDAARRNTSHPAPAYIDMSVADHSVPYTDGVNSLCVSSPLRIFPSQNSNYQVLFRDEQGIVAVHKRLGRGHVILMTNDLVATNRGIAEDDNSIFLMNVAANGASSTKSQIAFDEYHHGVGFESESPGGISALVDHMPGPLRWTLLDLVAFALIVVYIGNLRRGPIVQINDFRIQPSGDYVLTMARLYRRARARDLVIQIFYNRLLYDVRRQLNISPDATPAQVVTRFSESFEADISVLGSVVKRCEESLAGSHISERELVALAASIDQFRREFGIVGHQQHAD